MRTRTAIPRRSRGLCDHRYLSAISLHTADGRAAGHRVCRMAGNRLPVAVRGGNGPHDGDGSAFVRRRMDTDDDGDDAASVAPLASMNARSLRSSRVMRLALFAGGYLLVWAAVGIPAFVLESLTRNVASADPRASTVAAAAIFAWSGAYQVTPLKRRCLKHCRSPVSLLLRYGSYRGALRDMHAGLHHGAYCLGCCWSLFILLIAFGTMNLAAMLVLAAIVLIEKLWAKGETFSRAVAAAAFGLAIAVLFFPEVAP
jgi:hypothetical protein